MSESKLMFSFWDGGWGHFTRAMALATEAHARGHEVGMITSPKYVSEIGAAGIASTVEVIPNRNPDSQPSPHPFPYYSHAFGHSQRLLGLRFDDTEWLHNTVQREANALAEFKPDAIINDYRDTTRMAAQTLGIQVAGITHTSGNVHGKPLGWWVRPPAGAKIPDALPAFNHVRRKLGLDEISDERELFSGDINLIPGIPEMDPLIKPSEESHYVGKLTWNPSERSFSSLADKDLKQRVFSYVGEKTRPQYGYEAMLQQVIADRPDIGFYVVGERNRYDSRAIGNRITQGSVIVDDYIPALAAMEDVDVVLTHGGHETAMAALSHDRPLICVGPYQTDCSSTFAEIQHQGAGLLLNHSEQPLTRRKAPDLGDGIDVFGYWHTELTADRIGASIDEVLGDPSYATNAARLGRSIRSLGGASLALDVIESKLL